MHHSIAGRRFEILLNARLKDAHGFCTDPGLPGATIQIAAGLSPDDLLESIIHEALHAAAYKLLSEYWVQETAHDIATLLLRLGVKIDT